MRWYCVETYLKQCFPTKWANIWRSEILVWFWWFWALRVWFWALRRLALVYHWGLSVTSSKTVLFSPHPKQSYSPLIQNSLILSSSKTVLFSPHPRLSYSLISSHSSRTISGFVDHSLMSKLDGRREHKHRKVSSKEK